MPKKRVDEIQVCFHTLDNTYTVVARRGSLYTRYPHPTKASLDRFASLSWNPNIKVLVTLTAGDASPGIFFSRTT